MIILKTKDEIDKIRNSCKLAADVIVNIEPYVVPGITTERLDQLCYDFILKRGAVPSCLGYKGFPKSICTSINEVACHGIPNQTVLKSGDIINIDVATLLEGFHGDTSKTFLVGKTSRAARELVHHAYEALIVGINAVEIGGHLGDIGAAIQAYAESKGYTIVQDFCAHGIGRNLHEPPTIPHFGIKGTGDLIQPGMVFTIEPILNKGKRDIITLEDGWTVKTLDGKLSAQFEHTIAIHDSKIEILTLPSWMCAANIS